MLRCRGVVASLVLRVARELKYESKRAAYIPIQTEVPRPFSASIGEGMEGDRDAAAAESRAAGKRRMTQGGQGSSPASPDRMIQRDGTALPGADGSSTTRWRHNGMV